MCNEYAVSTVRCVAETMRYRLYVVLGLLLTNYSDFLILVISSHDPVRKSSIMVQC
jgi:hypothetical protein